MLNLDKNKLLKSFELFFWLYKYVIIAILKEDMKD